MRRSIFQYKDPLQYIIDVFQDRKNQNPAFSVRQWAEQMGLKNSTLLALLLKGQRPIRVKFVEFLSRGLLMDEAEELYFKTLILRKNARSDEELGVFDTILAQIAPGEMFSADYTDSESVFNHWSTMTLLTATKIQGFSLEPEKAREYFLKDVDVETLKNGLKLLQEEGLLQKDEDENLSPVFQRVSSQNGKKNIGARRYFHQVFDMAKDAIEMPIEERELQSFSIAIDVNKLSIARELVRDLRNRLAALEDSQANRIYHANLQLFPMTKKLDRVTDN